MCVADRLLALVLLAGCTPKSGPEGREDRSPDHPTKVEPAAIDAIASLRAEAPPSPRPPFDETGLDAITLSMAKMRENAIYTPGPKVHELAQTEARRTKTPLIGIVPFCIGVNGKPTYVETPSTGDAEVDVLLRKAVNSWRFRPFIVHGIARKACSAAEFEISFAEEPINASVR
jgi:hypothetical protein